MGLTIEGKDKLLECMFLGTAAPKLFLAVYLKNEKGLIEIKGNGYERMSLDNILSVKGGILTNKEEIVFPLAKRGWGVVSAIGIIDESGNQFYLEETLDPTPKMLKGKRLRIPVEALQIVLE